MLTFEQMQMVMDFAILRTQIGYDINNFSTFCTALKEPNFGTSHSLNNYSCPALFVTISCCKDEKTLDMVLNTCGAVLYELNNPITQAEIKQLGFDQKELMLASQGALSIIENTFRYVKQMEETFSKLDKGDSLTINALKHSSMKFVDIVQARYLMRQCCASNKSLALDLSESDKVTSSVQTHQANNNNNTTSSSWFMNKRK